MGNKVNTGKVRNKGEKGPAEREPEGSSFCWNDLAVGQCCSGRVSCQSPPGWLLSQAPERCWRWNEVGRRLELFPMLVYVKRPASRAQEFCSWPGSCESCPHASLEWFWPLWSPDLFLDSRPSLHWPPRSHRSLGSGTSPSLVPFIVLPYSVCL